MTAAAAITVTSYASGTLDGATDDPTNHDVQVKSDNVQAIYSHDIVWGSLEFETQWSNWNTRTHKYNSLKFAPVSEGADIIKVTNHSNVPLTVSPAPVTNDFYKDTVELSFTEGPNFDNSIDINGDYVYNHEYCNIYTIPAANATDGAKTAEIQAKVWLPSENRDSAPAKVQEKLGSEFTTVGNFTIVLLTRVPEEYNLVEKYGLPEEFGYYLLEPTVKEYMSAEEYAAFQQEFDEAWDQYYNDWWA